MTSAGLFYTCDDKPVFMCLCMQHAHDMLQPWPLFTVNSAAHCDHGLRARGCNNTETIERNDLVTEALTYMQRLMLSLNTCSQNDRLLSK